MIITSHVPGQEKGNTELVVGAGAGARAPTIPELVAHVERLRCQRATLEAMRQAAARIGRPHATAAIARLPCPCGRS